MGATRATGGEGGMEAGMEAGGACKADGPAQSVLSWSST